MLCVPRRWKPGENADEGKKVISGWTAKKGLTMTPDAICKAIVDSSPYPVVYVDLNHVIRYLNPMAVYHYQTERGYSDLLGRSLFTCHTEQSKEKILQAVEHFKRGGQEILLMVNVKNHRVYISPVRDSEKKLIGYYERFELNLAK
jgi:DUF438 domain-containing protein